jgi:hypothetical protein
MTGDNRHDTSKAGKQDLAVRAHACYESVCRRPEADQNERRLTEHGHTTRKGNKSRDIATGWFARAPAPAYPTPGRFTSNGRAGSRNDGKGTTHTKNPIAAAVSETIASLCPGLKPVSRNCSDHHNCQRPSPVLRNIHIHRPHDAPSHRHFCDCANCETASTRVLAPLMSPALRTDKLKSSHARELARKEEYGKLQAFRVSCHPVTDLRDFFRVNRTSQLSLTSASEICLCSPYVADPLCYLNLLYDE